MDVKTLRELAKECRRAGIKHFKCAEYEFTLSDEAPESDYKKNKRTTSQLQETTSNTEVQSDSLTEQELLFWSSGGPDNNDNAGTQ